MTGICISTPLFNRMEEVLKVYIVENLIALGLETYLPKRNGIHSWEVVHWCTDSRKFKMDINNPMIDGKLTGCLFYLVEERIWNNKG